MSKEKLPIDFITNFVSKGWDEVGNLKASIEAIEKEFTGTKVVSQILQDLVDSYLVALGQMELHLNKKDYLDIPTEQGLTESFNVSEDLDNVREEGEAEIALPDFDINVEQLDDSINIKVTPAESDADNKDTKELEDNTTEMLAAEPFDYFIDFDDADITEEEAESIKQFKSAF